MFCCVGFMFCTLATSLLYIRDAAPTKRNKWVLILVINKSCTGFIMTCLLLFCEQNYSWPGGSWNCFNRKLYVQDKKRKPAGSYTEDCSYISLSNYGGIFRFPWCNWIGPEPVLHSCRQYLCNMHLSNDISYITITIPFIHKYSCIWT